MAHRPLGLAHTVMTSEIETVEPDQPLAEAAQIMFDHKIGCLPVVEGSRVIGILTESDFVKYFARGQVQTGAELRLKAVR